MEWFVQGQQSSEEVLQTRVLWLLEVRFLEGAKGQFSQAERELVLKLN